MAVKKYAQTISNQSGTYPDVIPYKRWDYLSNLSSENGTAYCRHESQTDSPTIAGKNGTYKRPCPIDFRDFGFNLDSTLVIERVTVSYKHQKFINNGYYPGFAGATVTLLGTSVQSKTGSAIPTTSTRDSVTFYGVTVAELNSSNFGVRFSYPANSETTPGRIELSDFYVEVVTNLDGLRLALESNFDKNPITVGDNGSVTFTVKKTSDDAHNANIVIDMPLGLTVGTQTRSAGTVTRSTQTRNGASYTRLEWDISLPSTSNSVHSSSISFNISAVSPSSSFSNVEDARKCTMTESISHVTYENKLTIQAVKVKIGTNLYSDNIAIPEDYDKEILFSFEQDDPSEEDKVIHLSFTNGISIVNLNAISDVAGVDSAVYGNNTSGVLITVDGSVESLEIPVTINASSGGEFQVYVYTTLPNSVNVIGNIISKRFVVRPSDAGALGFTRLLINEYWTGNMADGVNYTVGCMSQIINSRNDLTILDYADNFRIGVFNSPNNINDETAFLQGVVWSRNISLTTLQENTVTFNYDERYPIYIVFSYTYEDDPLVEYTEFVYTDPFIVEMDAYAETFTLGHSLWPVTALLGDTSLATGTMNSNVYTTSPISVSSWDGGGTFEQNISPLGLDVQMNYITSEPVMLRCTLYIDDEHTGSRDMLIQEGSGIVHFNNGLDLFGLKPKDFINNNFDFEIRVTVVNVYGNNAYVELNNLFATMSYVFRNSCGFGVLVNGESSRDYGFRVTSVAAPFSTDHEESEYKVTGTDTTIINRLNIDAKEIELTIAISQCTYNEKVYLIDKLVELFTNDRELRSNKPIPKELIFEHLDDRVFPFVRVKKFDEEYKGANYYATITLKIPSGTSYAIDKTVTGPTGAAPSTIVLSPDIFYFSSTNGEMVITEENLNQEFLVQSPYIKANDTIYIDTSNRRIYVQKLEGDVDITGSVDYNSQWFKIKGEYSFQSETGTITSVEYNIRR